MFGLAPPPIILPSSGSGGGGGSFRGGNCEGWRSKEKIIKDPHIFRYVKYLLTENSEMVKIIKNQDLSICVFIFRILNLHHFEPF